MGVNNPVHSPHQNLLTNAHRSTIYNSSKLKTTPINSTDEQIDKTHAMENYSAVKRVQADMVTHACNSRAWVEAEGSGFVASCPWQREREQRYWEVSANGPEVPFGRKTHSRIRQLHAFVKGKLLIDYLIK